MKTVFDFAPLLNPTALQPYGLPTFLNAADAIAAYRGDDQIYALYPRKIEAAARLFLGGFPGHVLYAVKANPHPSLLNILWTEGVRRFDVASLREVALVRDLFPAAELFLMHPVTVSYTHLRAHET